RVTPSVNRTIIGDLVFRPVDPRTEEGKRRFETIRNTKDAGLLEAFIYDFPDIPETPEARDRLKRLNQDRLDQQRQIERAQLRKQDDDFWNSIKGSTS